MHEPKGITVSVGGEIGEVGGKNSTVEEVRADMDGYNRSLGGGVQHGASTLPADVQEALGKSLEERFTFLFELLNVPNTADVVKKHVTVPPVHTGRETEIGAARPALPLPVPLPPVPGRPPATAPGARPPAGIIGSMSILKIAHMGNPVLRKRARKVEASEIKSPAFQKLVDDMIETMREYEGIGLAAPQVHEPVRLVVIGLEERRGDERSIRILPVVNPEIAPVGKDAEEDWEGCLSLPKMRGRVVRPHAIVLKGLDRRGNKMELDLEGYPARVAQHEIDHLDGTLFIDRMKSLETLTFQDEFSRYWAKD